MERSSVFALSPFSGPLIEMIDSELSKTSLEYRKLFGFSFYREPFVLLLNSRKDLDMAWGEKTGDWVVGFARNGNIFILHPDKIKTESCHVDADEKYFQGLLRHELFHLYQHQALQGRLLPNWICEGSACYFARQDKMPATRADLLSVFGKTVYSPYVVGYHWTKMLVEKWGKKKFIKLMKSLKGIKSKKGFKEKFFLVYGTKFSKKPLSKMIDGYIDNGSLS